MLWQIPDAALIGGAFFFDSRAKAIGTLIPGSIEAVMTNGYNDVGDGGGATFTKVAGPLNDGASFQSADGAWWLLTSDEINVRMFGAVGDGATDDSAAINNANDFANANGKSLTFTSGIYSATGLLPTVSWYGEVGAVIKNSVSADQYSFIRCDGQENLEYVGLTFDGNVSADPPVWNSGNYDSFTGTIAFFVLGCENIRFSNCNFQNSFWSNIRVENCSYISIEQCRFQHARGNYGDLIYIRNSNYCTVSNINGYDFTRIGIVTENGSFNCTFSDCNIEYGHDASINYGGLQYNSGIWYENSGNNITTNCQAINTGNYGFVSTTGTITNLPSTFAYYNFIGCYAEGASVGFSGRSLPPTPVTQKYIGCEAWNCGQGFLSEANQTGDSYLHESCHAELVFSGGSNDIAFMWDSETLTNPATFTWDNCTTSYKNYNLAELNNTGVNSADISTFNGGNASLVIRNVRNIDGAYPLYIKGRSGDLSLSIDNCNVTIPTFGNMDGRGSIVNSTINASIIGGSGSMNISTCVILGTVTLNMTGNIAVDNCAINPGAGYLQISRSAVTARPALRITNCRFEKDIATNDYVLRIQESGATKPLNIIENCIFYNTGGATAVNSFIWFPNAPTPQNYAGCFSDSNVTYLVKSNTTLQNPSTGNTLVTMH